MDIKHKGILQLIKLALYIFAILHPDLLAALDFKGIALVSDLNGEGIIYKLSHDGAKTQIRLREEINQGDIIETNTKSHIEVLFADNSLMLIGEESRIEIVKYIIGNETNKNQEQKGLIKLDRGKIWVIIISSNGKNLNFTIETISAKVMVRGTSLVVNYKREGRITEVTMFEGTAGVINRTGNVKSEVLIKSGYRVMVKEYQQPSKPVVMSKDDLTRFKEEVFPG